MIVERDSMFTTRATVYDDDDDDTATHFSVVHLFFAFSLTGFVPVCALTHASTLDNEKYVHKIPYSIRYGACERGGLCVHACCVHSKDRALFLMDSKNIDRRTAF